MGLVEIGARPEDLSTRATDVSADGTVIAGYGSQVAGEQGFRWTALGGFESSGFMAGFNLIRTEQVSADGSTLGGFLADTSLPSRIAAVRWKPGDALEELGYLPGGSLGVFSQALAYDVSADGAVVVGESYSGGGFIQQAFRWTESVGMEGLGFLPNNRPPGEQQSIARLVSWDGNVVVGESIGLSGGDETFRWTADAGMHGLGTLPGQSGSLALAISADGSIVVGYSGEFAYIWDLVHGMRSLQDVFINEYGLGPALSGWTLTQARLMSADGNVILGSGRNPQGVGEGWVVVLNAVVPEPGTLALAVLGCAGLLLFARRRLAG
jgi:probable HAF family extracellular repeat protein